MLFVVVCVFFFKQKTAYEMRISDWSSDVCSSDLDLLEQIMDRVAEFVEQRRRVVDADQRRLAVRGFGEIIVVRREDVALAAQRLLAAIGRHPCARPFPLPRAILQAATAHILFLLGVIDPSRPALRATEHPAGA